MESVYVSANAPIAFIPPKRGIPILPPAKKGQQTKAQRTQAERQRRILAQESWKHARSMASTIEEAKAARKAVRRERKNRVRMADQNAVYVVAMGPFLKIGFSRSSVIGRINSLQTGSPMPLVLRATHPHPQPAQLEAFVHAVLAEHRACGEWFLCETDDVQAAVDLAAPLIHGGSVSEWRSLAAGLGAEPLALTEEERRVRGGSANLLAKGRELDLARAFVSWLESAS